MQSATENLTDTLVERVEKLINARHEPVEWGDPRLSVTPRALAIEQLTQRMEALENALLEIALKVQKLADHD